MGGGRGRGLEWIDGGGGGRKPAEGAVGGSERSGEGRRMTYCLAGRAKERGRPPRLVLLAARLAIGSGAGDARSCSWLLEAAEGEGRRGRGSCYDEEGRDAIGSTDVRGEAARTHIHTHTRTATGAQLCKAAAVSSSSSFPTTTARKAGERSAIRWSKAPAAGLPGKAASLRDRRRRSSKRERAQQQPPSPDRRLHLAARRCAAAILERGASETLFAPKGAWIGRTDGLPACRPRTTLAGRLWDFDAGGLSPSGRDLGWTEIPICASVAGAVEPSERGDREWTGGGSCPARSSQLLRRGLLAEVQRRRSSSRLPLGSRTSGALASPRERLIGRGALPAGPWQEHPAAAPAPSSSSSSSAGPPETFKKSKKSVRAHGKGPACYEIVPLALKKKMAAELYPASANTNLAHSNTAAAAAANSKKNALQLQQSAQPPPPPPLQNLNNNNVETSANWQSFHPTLRERNALMFNNELMADVHFIVGPVGAAKKVPAHKYVLAVGSSVFYAMFYGDLAEVKSEIHIPDVEPAAFLILLKYMYSDEIDLEADTVLATLYAAKKYIVPALAKACVNFLETSLEAKNACVLLSQSRLFEEPELTQRCWEVIDAQAEMALKSEGFCEIDQQTLEIIVTREALNTKEVVVFEAVLNWAEAECKRQGLPITPRNKRNVLGKALYLVRIPTMTLEEFANGAAQSDILTLEERHNIFLWYTAANKPKLEFPLTKRKGLAPQRCHRFQSSAYRSNQWRYRGRCDSIQFAVDKRIFIAGLGLYGSSCGKAEYSVKIELKRLGAVLAQNLTKFTSDGSSNTFSVWFEHPVQVEQDTFYNVSAILDGSELSYFGQEGMTEVQCGKVTFQFQCSSDSTNGTGVQGGQIPELIFYA